MQISKTKPYDSVSVIYNGLMAKVDYSLWANYIFSLVKENVNSESYVLDLGAGNCILAGYMNNYFSNVIAADISLPMLRNDSESNIIKVCCDMRRLPFRQKFSLIYSNFDCINYLLKKDFLKNLFIDVSAALKKDGIFTFDVCLEANSRDNIRKEVSEGSYRSIEYKQVSVYNKLRKIHKHIFTLYYPNGQVKKEIHRQKIFSFNTYIRLIKNSGLELLSCYETFTRRPGNSESKRIQFILKKRAN